MEDGDRTYFNFDEAELKVIFELRLSFLVNLKEWNLEKGFWDLRMYYNECKIFMEETEIKTYDESMVELEKIRAKIVKDRVIDEQEKIEFYIALEKFYNQLNKLIKKYELCFGKRSSEQEYETN